MRTDCRVTTQFGLYILFQLSGYTSDFRRTFHKLQLIAGCEGLEPQIAGTISAQISPKHSAKEDPFRVSYMELMSVNPLLGS